MYLYFDKNGALREIINNDAIRQGNNNANEVYVYFEDAPSLDTLSAIVKLPDRTLSNEIYFGEDLVEASIPYNAKADYKYFKDFVKYRFYVLKLNMLLSQSGLYVMTIRAFIDNSIFAKGEITFNAEPNVINTDNGITQSQYDYLLSLVYQGVTFVPSVSNEGVISWTNTGSLPNPDPVNIKGPQGYSIVKANQTQTSTESSGVNLIEFVSESGDVVGKVEVRNGAKGDKGEDAVNATWFAIDDNGHLIMYNSVDIEEEFYLVSESNYQEIGVSSDLIGHLVCIY